MNHVRLCPKGVKLRGNSNGVKEVKLINIIRLLPNCEMLRRIASGTKGISSHFAR